MSASHICTLAPKLPMSFRMIKNGRLPHSQVASIPSRQSRQEVPNSRPPLISDLQINPVVVVVALICNLCQEAQDLEDNSLVDNQQR